MLQHAHNPRAVAAVRIPDSEGGRAGDLSAALRSLGREAFAEASDLAGRRCTSRDPSTGGMFKMACI